MEPTRFLWAVFSDGLSYLQARDELDAANKRFNAKMFATRQEAAKGRSKLAATAASMDKKVKMTSDHAPHSQSTMRNPIP